VADKSGRVAVEKSFSSLVGVDVCDELNHDGSIVLRE
jgi:hypothetical protein